MSPPFTIGVSLKMYFTHAQTLQWSRDVAEICATHPAITGGLVEFFVAPTYPAIPAVVELLPGLTVGAQDVSSEDLGAFTGEVSGAELFEVGCRVVEVGHAERRRLLGETDEVVARKTAAAMRNGLVPVVCVGEDEPVGAAAATAEIVAQARAALAEVPRTGPGQRVVLAYEPNWAIGAAEPAAPSYIREVCRGVRDRLEADLRFPELTLIYGGSAGPGLLQQVAPEVSGLFLGRFAHDPRAVRLVLDEVCEIAARERPHGVSAPSH